MDLSASEDRKWLMFRMGELYGWCVKGFLDEVIEEQPTPPEEFPWMSIAEGEKGVSEIAGAGNNSRVLEYLQATSNLGSAARSISQVAYSTGFGHGCPSTSKPHLVCQ